MIYTTYFGKLNSTPQLLKKVTPIAVCAKMPENCTFLQFKELAPKYDDFMKYKNGGSWSEFAQAYNEHVLAFLDAKKLGNELILSASIGKDPVLVCYEKSESSCHRKLIADWLRGAGFEVQELG